MTQRFTQEQEQAWIVFAQTWVDTEYDAQDRSKFVETLRSTELPAPALRRICYWEVCGAFATFSTMTFLTAGMALPDWYYPEDLAREKISKWLSRPVILSLINPFWLIGYLLSVFLMRSTMGQVLAAASGRA